MTPPIALTEERLREITTEFGITTFCEERRTMATELLTARATIATQGIKVTNLFNALEAKQAKIDALMLEFCPGEMPAEQREEWARNQVARDPLAQPSRGKPQSQADLISTERIVEGLSLLEAAANSNEWNGELAWIMRAQRRLTGEDGYCPDCAHPERREVREELTEALELGAREIEASASWSHGTAAAFGKKMAAVLREHAKYAALLCAPALSEAALTPEQVAACEAGAGAMELLHDHARALPVLHTVLKKAGEIVKGNSDMGTKQAERMWLSLMEYLRPKAGGEIVNPHVLPAIHEPQPDFDKMLAVLNADAATLRDLASRGRG